MTKHRANVLLAAEREQFIEEGYVVVRECFSRAVAEEGRDVVWDALQLSRAEPKTWREPIIHLRYGFSDGPFRRVLTDRLVDVFDDILGARRWTFNEGYGWWPVLFPGFAAGQRFYEFGWHVDGEGFRHTLRVPEKAMVSIFLFSDVAAGDGGTAVFTGSHRRVARIIAESEPEGVDQDVLTGKLPLPRRPDEVVEITGQAGDVLFMHPFIVHASSPNSGTHVRFACNPLVALVAPMNFARRDEDLSLTERAIVEALRLRSS
jgi:ectoine hydroxylase-related dioxygenase (phytanoyl-CoA dioxygenase family)